MLKRDQQKIWERKVCQWSHEDLMESRWKPGQEVVDQPTRHIFSFLFAELEAFLDESVSDEALPFVPRNSTNRGDEYDYTHLAERYFTRIPEFLELVEQLPSQNRYSEHVEAFITCCREMGLFGRYLDWHSIFLGPSKTYPKFGGASGADLFNLLVAKLRERCQSEQTKEKARRRRREADERVNEYASYVDALFRKWARLVVLRIDLEYRKEFKDQISIVDALADLDRFMNNQRNNSLFRDKVGYIVKLEYGVLKGVHFHLILFFDGSKRDGRKDVHLAQDIGEYWVKVITKGRGNYWNINAHKGEYEQKDIRGIGVINAHEIALINNLKKRVVAYLCKSTQFVQPVLPAELQSRRRNKLIRRGDFPDKPQKKRGRPRKAQELQ